MLGFEVTFRLKSSIFVASHKQPMRALQINKNVSQKYSFN